MREQNTEQRRARFASGGAGETHGKTRESRKGRWTGYYPLAEAVAEARLALIEEQQEQPKEVR